MHASKLLFGQTTDGQQSAAELQGEGIYRGVGVILLVVLVLVGGKEPSGSGGSEVSSLHSTAVLKAAEIRTESILCVCTHICMCVCECVCATNTSHWANRYSKSLTNRNLIPSRSDWLLKLCLKSGEEE